MPDFSTLESQVNILKLQIDALNTSTLNAEQILYLSQTLATLANALGVDDVIAATAAAVAEVEAAGLATVEVVEGTANGAVVTNLISAYDTLQASFNNINPRVTSLEALSTAQESSIATAAAAAAAVSLNPWEVVTESRNLFNKDRVFVVPDFDMELALPPGPNIGAVVEIVDVAGTAETIPFTVLRSNSLIQGIDEDLEFNVNSQALKLVYAGSDYGWRIV
jgi:hypothetical protein